jgi:hypothetical protein
MLHLEHSFIWCWNLDASGEGWERSVGLIMWEVKKYYLQSLEQWNTLYEISKWKANWIGQILRRDCLLQGVEVTGRWGRRHRKLLDELRERRRYCHLKEEALDRTLWRAGFGRGFGPVIRQTAKWMNEWMRKCTVRIIEKLKFLQWIIMHETGIFYYILHGRNFVI